MTLPSDLLEDVVVTGAGLCRDPGIDPRPFLKERKMRKFMGAQDRLALVAARAALESAGLSPESEELGPAAGLYLCVGYLPSRPLRCYSGKKPKALPPAEPPPRISA